MALTATAVFPGAELERIFNGDILGYFVCTGALRLEVEADPCARDGFAVETAIIVADAKDESGEVIGPNHRDYHAVTRFCRLHTTINEVHAALEYERAGQKDAA